MKLSIYSQKGGVLFVALIMLLLVTIFAISSVRQATLESRITGGVLEERRLLNAAESGLRNTEITLSNSLLPPDKCPTPASLPCLWSKTASYTPDFSDAALYQGYGIDNPNRIEVKRYLIAAPDGSAEGQSVNPEYGNMMMGSGTFMYEANSLSDTDERKTSLRSVYARVFNN